MLVDYSYQQAAVAVVNLLVEPHSGGGRTVSLSSDTPNIAVIQADNTNNTISIAVILGRQYKQHN